MEMTKEYKEAKEKALREHCLEMALFELELNKCEFYPNRQDDPVCDCNADVSGIFVCTKRYSLICQWAIERRKKMGDIADMSREQEEDAQWEGPSEYIGPEYPQGQTELKKSIRTFYIAGVKFHQYKTVLNDVTEGDNLMLILETDPSILKYDQNAVRIIFDNFDKSAWIGFVPMKFSSEIRGLIEIGKKLECILTGFIKSAKTWEMFKVEIREVEDE